VPLAEILLTIFIAEFIPDEKVQERALRKNFTRLSVA